jgi:hypothetical protein
MLETTKKLSSLNSVLAKTSPPQLEEKRQLMGKSGAILTSTSNFFSIARVKKRRFLFT